MNDTLSSELRSAKGLRFHQVTGDLMEPTIRHRDFVLLAPVNRYIGEGYYLVDSTFHEPAVYSCNGPAGTRQKPAINLHPHNKFYRGSTMLRGEFEALVLGKVAMICKVVDHHLLPEMPL